MMGEDFFHVHHYCYGLRNLLHAQAAGENTPRGKDLLRRAQREFRYMFRTASPTMPLMPEIHLKDGEIHLKLGNLQEANLSFERARVLKPDYWPAYTRWADVLIGLKLHDPARKLLEEGLVHSPGQPELTRRLVALPGTKRTPQAESGPAAARAVSPAASR
jgi:tetratricopeptide (TPR) repeat protein